MSPTKSTCIILVVNLWFGPKNRSKLLQTDPLFVGSGDEIQF